MKVPKSSSYDVKVVIQATNRCIENYNKAILVYQTKIFAKSEAES